MKFVMIKLASLVLIIAVLIPRAALADIDENYQNRRAIILNTCPFVQLGGFSFQNRFNGRSSNFETAISWKNVGTVPVIAFEIITLKYDAFDRRLVGETWTVTGTNSANWRPLQPGAESTDGTMSSGTQKVLTAIAYIRSARLADGTVWAVSDSELSAELRRAAPLREPGSLKPDAKP